MATNYIPSADATFNSWQQQAFDYINAQSERFSIDSSAIESFENIKRDWEQKYAVASGYESTHAAIVAKQECRRAYEKFLRDFVNKYIRYNDAVTDSDRANMGLPILSTKRTPSPVPSTYPEHEVDTSVIRRITIHFKDNGASSKAKPRGVHGAEMRWVISPAQPARIEDMPHTAFDTHTPLTLEFTEEQRGNRLYFALCWINTRGDRGPWSEIGMAIVP
jgi:hypothetical protein